MEENLLKTKEELHIVMTSTTSAPAPPPAPASSSSSSSSSDSESDHEQSEHSEENSTYSAELQTQGINDHRQEEERLTEAEKNERLQKKLMVSSGSQETVHIRQKLIVRVCAWMCTGFKSPHRMHCVLIKRALFLLKFQEQTFSLSSLHRP